MSGSYEIELRCPDCGVYKAHSPKCVTYLRQQIDHLLSLMDGAQAEQMKLESEIARLREAISVALLDKLTLALEAERDAQPETLRVLTESWYRGRRHGMVEMWDATRAAAEQARETGR